MTRRMLYVVDVLGLLFDISLPYRRRLECGRAYGEERQVQLLQARVTDL